MSVSSVSVFMSLRVCVFVSLCVCITWMPLRPWNTELPEVVCVCVKCVCVCYMGASQPWNTELPDLCVCVYSLPAREVGVSVFTNRKSLQ